METVANAKSVAAALWEVRALLQGHRFRFIDEVQLHQAIADLFQRQGIAYEREKVITPISRLDFYLPLWRIGVEVKVQGSLQPAMRQVERYLAHPDVDAMLLASSRAWARRTFEVGPISASNPKLFGVAYMARPL